MSEIQKNIIERLLKERRKTKRELAKYLEIKENSINRTLKSPSIALSKLGMVAEFLEVDIIDLLPKKNFVQEQGEEYRRLNPFDTTNQLTINNLSEALSRNSKTIDSLVRIIAEHFPEKKE